MTIQEFITILHVSVVTIQGRALGYWIWSDKCFLFHDKDFCVLCAVTQNRREQLSPIIIHLMSHRALVTLVYHWRC